MFAIDASSIDKSLPVPVGTQLHGLLNYSLSFGDIPHGTKLQSVRQLAAELGIAPMTVAHVYQQLRDAGLIEMRQGLGAFVAHKTYNIVADNAPAAALRIDIEVLLGKAERLGVPTTTLVSMINAQSQLRKPKAGLNVVFVAIFEGPGYDYIEQIRPVFASGDTISLLTLDGLRADEATRQACLSADLVLTFLNREAEVREIVPDANILALRFLPSGQTRQALAVLDPRSRVAAIAQLQDYIAVMRPSVREYAPHVSEIKVTWSAAPDIREIIAGSDAVVYATGADHIAEMVRPGIPCFEYRHAPDPASVENLLVPYLSELRQAKIAGNEHGSSEPAAGK